MLETKKPFAAGLALTLLAATGCYDFDTAFEECKNLGQCVPSTCDPSAVDVPDDLFYDANCDGIDGTPGDAIFVDPAGQDSNPGTPEAPLKRLSVALTLAANQGKAIYLAQGTYDEADLRMERAVSIYGGYAGKAGNWKRDKENITQIGGSTPTGFTVSGLMDAGVDIEWVYIRSANSSVPGTPSIGLRVLDSNGVRLSHVDVASGKGAPGRDGDSPGPTTQVGADGGVGLDGTAATPSGGPRGTSSCGAGSYAGGMGGVGGTAYLTPSGVGAAGEPYTTGGGTAGTNKINSNTGVCGDYCVCDGEAGGEGQPGAPGDRGKDGNPGDGTGVLEGSTWVPKSGTDGEAGTIGKGGGGGGGGGYCEAPASAQSRGGGGGGGGAGGCPGAGAKGGQGGGASIAMLLIRSQVGLESCTLKTGGGGRGGAGGTGGAGGAGGQGGTGGKGIPVDKSSAGSYTYRATGGDGGKGGKGGDGGPGGHGGNGAGGPSVGIWCDALETSSVTQKGMTFGLEDPGTPGAGPGPAGNRGLLTNYHQCTMSP